MKELREKFKEIMEDGTLNDIEKQRRIRRAAEHFVDEVCEAYPEILALRKRERAFERKFIPRGKHIFCPGCGWWVGERPAEAKRFDEEFSRIAKRKADELIRKIGTPHKAA